MSVIKKINEDTSSEIVSAATPSHIPKNNLTEEVISVECQILCRQDIFDLTLVSLSNRGVDDE